MFTVVAFYKPDVGTTLTPIPPVKDEHIVWYADSIRVPELNKLLAIWVYGTNVGQVRLVSPSLRADWLEDVPTFLVGDTLPQVQPVNEGGSGVYKVELDYAICDYGSSPLELTAGERFSVEAAAASGTTPVYVVCWFGDGVPSPVTGRIRTMRAALVCNTTPNEWSSATLVLGQALAVGTYSLVGLSVPVPGVLAARTIFSGQWWRPGVPGQTSVSVPLPHKFAVGSMGAFGSFTNETVPQLELLTTANVTAGTCYLSLIKTA